MAAPIGPGDWLLCVDTDMDGSDGVTFNGVYCVDYMWDRDDLDPCAACGSVDGFELVAVSPLPTWAWCACQFKPLGGGERLTAPPARVCEPA